MKIQGYKALGMHVDHFYDDNHLVINFTFPTSVRLDKAKKMISSPAFYWYSVR